jgi:hypothetical protein
VNRPEKGAIDWDHLARPFSAIYEMRSRALHDGTQFPFEMLAAPMRERQGGPYVEVFALPSVTSEIAPMHLHTFAYLVRGALRNWWASLATSHAAGG